MAIRSVNEETLFKSLCYIAQYLSVFWRLAFSETCGTLEELFSSVWLTSVVSMPMLTDHMVPKYSCILLLSGGGKWWDLIKSLRSRTFWWYWDRLAYILCTMAVTFPKIAAWLNAETQDRQIQIILYFEMDQYYSQQKLNLRLTVMKKNKSLSVWSLNWTLWNSWYILWVLAVQLRSFLSIMYQAFP